MPAIDFDYPIRAVELDFTSYGSERAVREAIRCASTLPDPDAIVTFQWNDHVRVAVKRDSNPRTILQAMYLAKTSLTDENVGPYPLLASRV
jgi:hypothetical protein